MMHYYMPHAAMPAPAGGRLAEHETLELHELLAFKTGALVRQKQAVSRISDPELRRLYLESIATTERHIRELMNLLQHRPFMP